MTNEKITTKTGRRLKAIIGGDHRNGICIECKVQMEVKDIQMPLKRTKIFPTGKLDEDGHEIYEKRDILIDRLVKRPVCPLCGGMIGHLIARSVSIQNPDPPQCLSFKCLFKFMRDSLFIALISSYHSRRVAYAQINRPEKGKVILERYRTGDPSPKSLWQAIHANIKLRCPICRKYNTDPFLFGGKQNGSNGNLA